VNVSEFYLEVKDIKKSFGGIQALKGVSMRIRPGEAHCLVGENGCGKSTLIKVISGFYTPDEGHIVIDEKSFRKLTPSESMALGVQVIYQDFSLFGNLSVAENIAMAYNVSSKFKFADKRRDLALAERILAEIGVELDPLVEVARISVAQKQIVAICRALLQNAKLVIMDEPTTALTTREIDSLFRIIGGLKKQGVALLFVSHKLDEVFEVSEVVNIMRNGSNIVDGPTAEFDKSKMVYYMTGREIAEKSYEMEIDRETPILRVKNLSRKDEFRNVNFEVYRGEVLGITGLLGSGRTPLAETLFGIVRKTEGEIYLNGQKLEIRNAGDAVRAGIGYVPEDRLTQGLFLKISIFRNIAATILSMYSNRLSFMNKRKIALAVRRQAKDLAIRGASLDDPASSLSGGNQQRVVLAKWLAAQPKLLIFNCPTVGVDVGSKSEIHEIIVSFAQRGIGIVVISDDLPEILSLCNRVLVMNVGEITGEYPTRDISEEFLQQQLIKA
jgi:simple sugar transport system ATP-binding protein